MPSTMARSKSVLSRREIEGLIAAGGHIVIVDGKVLQCNAWMPYHPGGDKAIRHMIGRDATDEVNALHSVEARKRMDSYQIGRIEGRWGNFVPPIQGGKIRRLDEEQVPQDEDSSTTSWSDSSPIDDGLRRRKGDLPSHLPSVSSDPAGPRMSHIDVKTQEEIELDLSKYPSLDPAVQDAITRKYRLLGERIKAEGLYQCNYWAYLVEVIRYGLLLATSMYLLRSGWYMTSALFLGLFWHQIVFTAHDAGHMGITHNFHVDSIIGIFVANFLGGLSLGWWKKSHNIHHIVTNSPEHDPDIQQMPFFAVSHRFYQSLRSSYYDCIMYYDASAKVVLPLQHYLFYIILLFGRFNLYVLSYTHVLLRQNPRKGPARLHWHLELVGLAFFCSWFGYLVLYRSLPSASTRLLYVLISHMVTAPVHVQITLSHFCMSTADLGAEESFPQKMLRTTMDVDCPTWLDFIHGGLQFQVIHHLFPRVPRHNLRKAQQLVQEFCNEVGIPYALYGFVDGNKRVIGRLESVARQAAILAECHKVMADSF